ncbi:MAG TPA: DUF6249 domain-containing protein [Steroidobacteraceae bacterium]|nr:DUF6249 domain-containing protein [Steroidobacteraceae bacterium]
MNEDIVAVFIPITAIIFGVSCAIVSIIVGHRQRMQRAELRHRERLAAIDKGLELPPDPPDFDANRARPRFLLRGLVLIFLGISLTIAMLQLRGSVPYLFGMIPAAVGLGYLVYYFIEGRRESSPTAPGSLADGSPRS